MRGSALLDQSIRARRNGGRDILVLLEALALFPGLPFAVVSGRSRVDACGVCVRLVLELDGFG